MKKLVSVLLILNMVLLSPVTAQDDLLQNTQRDGMIIIGATAGGAILGLSTLSFVETPSRHISNIWTGAALGLIAGVILVAYNSAQKGQEELLSHAPSAHLDTQDRVAWHTENHRLLSFQSVQFGTQFWQTDF